jgi:hypothetical protein
MKAYGTNSAIGILLLRLLFPKGLVDFLPSIAARKANILEPVGVHGG